MLIQIALLVAGLILLLIGANYLVDGSTVVARKFGMSEFAIGMTVVGIGTSLPELVVSFTSSYMGNGDVAIGNVVGSNILNVMLILGLTALIFPIAISKSNLKRDIPVSLASTALLIFMLLKFTLFGVGSNSLGRIEGAVLLVLYLIYLFISFKKDVQDEGEPEAVTSKSMWKSIFMIAGGLVALIFGGRLFVNSGVEIARLCHVPEAFVSIIILAFGTSLPELLTSIVAASKGRTALALGNVLGSNICNILLVLGGSALINPLTISGVTVVDLIIMMLSATFVLVCAYLFERNKVDRIEGLLLLLGWAGYICWLFMSL